MTVKELDKHLNQALINFSDEMRSQYDECGKQSATHADIHECSRQAFYAMNDMKNAIIAYLKEMEI